MPGQTEKAFDFLDGKRGLSPFLLRPERIPVTSVPSA
jgi:hypothetical protein